MLSIFGVNVAYIRSYCCCVSYKNTQWLLQLCVRITVIMNQKCCLYLELMLSIFEITVVVYLIKILSGYCNYVYVLP